MKVDQGTFSQCRVAMGDSNITCDGVTGNRDVKLGGGEVGITYGNDIPESCAIAVAMGDGSIRLSAPSGAPSSRPLRELVR